MINATKFEDQLRLEKANRMKPLNLVAIVLVFLTSPSVFSQDSNPRADAPSLDTKMTVEGAKVLVNIWPESIFLGPKNFPKMMYQSDANGWVEFMRPAHLRILRIFVSKGRFVPEISAWNQGEHNGGEDIPPSREIVLRVGSQIGSRVVDEDGNPIVGAKVNVFSFADGDEAAVTDANGLWHIDNVPAPKPNFSDGQFMLYLEHKDFVSDTSFRRISGDKLRDNPSDLMMAKGFRIKGSLLSHEGKPVKEGLVIWGSRPYFTLGRQEVQISKDGTFETSPLVPGSWTVPAIVPGSSPTLTQVNLTEDTEIELELEKPHTISFTINDQEGNPIPHASIGIQKWLNMESLYNVIHPNILESRIPFKCDEHGVYTWDWAPEDSISISIVARGYQIIETIVSKEEVGQVFTLGPYED